MTREQLILVFHMIRLREDYDRYVGGYQGGSGVQEASGVGAEAPVVPPGACGGKKRGK